MVSNKAYSIILNLEELRNNADARAHSIGSWFDYLDRGSPSEEDKTKTHKAIAEMEKAQEKARQKLRLIVENARIKEVFAEWKALHVRVCRSIIEDAEREDSPDTVRLYVAKETLTKWRTISAEHYDFFSINSYYLNDYNDYVKKELAQIKPADFDNTRPGPA